MLATGAALAAATSARMSLGRDRRASNRRHPRRYAPRSASAALPAAAVIAYPAKFPARRRCPAAQAATTHHSRAPSSHSPATATPDGNQMTAWSTESPAPSRT